MAVTTVQSSNKLIKYTQEINREFVRESLFSPYMGEDVTSIIRRRFDLKNGGEQMNIPLVTRLAGTGTGSGTLAGNEEKIDNYGMRVWLDWARHAIVTNKAEQQKDSAEIFGAAAGTTTRCDRIRRSAIDRRRLRSSRSLSTKPWRLGRG
jgi:uncharacterized protein DUF4043